MGDIDFFSPLIPSGSRRHNAVRDAAITTVELKEHTDCPEWHKRRTAAGDLESVLFDLNNCRWIKTRSSPLHLCIPCTAQLAAPTLRFPDASNLQADEVLFVVHKTCDSLIIILTVTAGIPREATIPSSRLSAASSDASRLERLRSHGCVT